MRIDVVSIFPDYFAPLALSLPGRARRTGLLDLHVHDLRDWTTDRHRTVDDTPYGGGPGMVMKPEPWGAALDALVAGTQDPPPVLVVPSPSGRPFTQAIAGQLAQEPRLLFACGRYEGIDQRVVDRAATRMRVLEVSLGDYVLNGGEVAALAMIEAVVRLLPGFLGNQQSLVEESHGEDRLLEGPVYTKPESWSGLDVPEVLLSGDHASIAAWRRARSLDRTAERRPDLAYPARTLRPGELPALAEGEDGVPEGKQAQWGAATHADAGELLTLQRACWVQEALANDTLAIPALHESLTDVEEDLARWLTLLLRFGGRLVGSVRAQRRGDEPEMEWLMGRLMVAPDLQGRGIGRWMLTRIEEAAPPGTRWITLVTGARSEDNLRMYRRAGYRPAGVQPDPAIVTLRKRLR